MLRVLVVGCGNIAGGFDAARDPALPPLTHAGAYQRHGGFALAACVEPDASRRAAFMQRWDVPQGFDSVTAAAAAGPFDVISVCSPTSFHAAQLAEAIALRPRLIFCEKPVTPSCADTAAAVAACEAAGIALAVNHTRRWDADLARLARELAAGEWGAVRSAVGTYNKGVLNNGSHMVDLLQQLLGTLHLLAAGAAVHDHWPDDPTVPALLHSAAGVPVHLNTAHAADYAVFELQLYTERAVVCMEDGGQQWRVRHVVDSAQFAGYRLPAPGERRPGAYLQATAAAVANVHDALLQRVPLASTGRSALAAQQLCEQIRAAAR